MASVRETIFFMLFGAALTLLVIPAGYFFIQPHRADMVKKYRSQAHPYTADSAVCDVEGSCQAAENESSVVTLKEASDEHGSDNSLLKVDNNYINEAVFGGLDGLLTMVAVMLGGIGADLSTKHILAMGVSNLIADGFSMSFGAYVSASAEREFAIKQQMEEYREVKETPSEEIREMVATYRARGLSDADARLVAGYFPSTRTTG